MTQKFVNYDRNNQNKSLRLISDTKLPAYKWKKSKFTRNLVRTGWPYWPAKKNAMVPPKTDQPKTIPIWMKFVIGSCSGSISTTIVQPADLVKTRMQLLKGPDAKLSGIAVARGIVHRKGIKGLYAGFSAALFRQVLYSGGRLGGFNTVFDMYKDEYKKVPNLRTKLVFGMASGIFGAIISMPPEVALIRMTADGRLPLDKRRNYKHVFDAMFRMVREEGVASLTRGFWPTMTRSMLLNGAQLATYAESREALLNTLGDGIALHFSASMISGFVTTLVSQPIDMVKTRIQNSAKKDATQLGVLRKIIRKQGILALWSGFMPSYIKIGPHTVMTFMFLEQFGAYYLKHYA